MLPRLVLICCACILAHCDRQLQAFVDAEGGLRMRNEPDLQAEVVALIPDGSQVSVLAVHPPLIEIDSRRGRWSQVSWNSKVGWVFGGLLRPIPGPYPITGSLQEFVASKKLFIDDPFCPFISFGPDGLPDHIQAMHGNATGIEATYDDNALHIRWQESYCTFFPEGTRCWPPEPVRA